MKKLFRIAGPVACIGAVMLVAALVRWWYYSPVERAVVIEHQGRCEFSYESWDQLEPGAEPVLVRCTGETDAQGRVRSLKDNKIYGWKLFDFTIGDTIDLTRHIKYTYLIQN